MPNILKQFLQHGPNLTQLLLIFSYDTGQLPPHFLLDRPQIVLTVGLNRHKFDEVTDRRVIQLWLVARAYRFYIIEREISSRKLEKMVFAIFIQNHILLLKLCNPSLQNLHLILENLLLLLKLKPHLLHFLLMQLLNLTNITTSIHNLHKRLMSLLLQHCDLLIYILTACYLRCKTWLWEGFPPVIGIGGVRSHT